MSTGDLAVGRSRRFERARGARASSESRSETARDTCDGETARASAVRMVAKARTMYPPRADLYCKPFSLSLHSPFFSINSVRACILRAYAVRTSSSRARRVARLGTLAHAHHPMTRPRADTNARAQRYFTAIHATHDSLVN